METRTFLFSADPHLFTIDTKIIPILYSGSYPLVSIEPEIIPIRLLPTCYHRNKNKPL